MPINHEDLKKCVKNLPEDYEPYGKKPRWYLDCSSGCLAFVKLAGELGNDWGVCTNPDSHRCGLLTFEHQGCVHAKLPHEERMNR